MLLVAVLSICRCSHADIKPIHCLVLPIACLPDRTPARRASEPCQTSAARVGLIGLLHLVTTERFDSAHSDQPASFFEPTLPAASHFRDFPPQREQFTCPRLPITCWETAYQPHLPSRIQAHFSQLPPSLPLFDTARHALTSASEPLVLQPWPHIVEPTCLRANRVPPKTRLIG